MEAASSSGGGGGNGKDSDFASTSSDPRLLRSPTLSSRSRVFDVNEEAPLLETARRAAYKARVM